MKKVILTAAIIAIIASLALAKTPKVKVCNFDGENKTKLYEIATAPGIGTAFQLPDGWEIQDFVVSDPKFFFGQSNGRIGVVKPIAEDHETSVIIYTTNEKLFVFHLSTKKSEEVDELVIVDVHDETFFKQKVKQEANRIASQKLEAMKENMSKEIEKKEDEAKQTAIASVNSAYEIEKNLFNVEKVSDDGILTYIYMPKAQVKPAVFVAKKDKPKEYEPVQYTDKGEYLQVNRVLGPQERFFLKSGKDISEVRRIAN